MFVRNIENDRGHNRLPFLKYNDTYPLNDDVRKDLNEEITQRKRDMQALTSSLQKIAERFQERMAVIRSVKDELLDNVKTKMDLKNAKQCQIEQDVSEMEAKLVRLEAVASEHARQVQTIRDTEIAHDELLSTQARNIETVASLLNDKLAAHKKQISVNDVLRDEREGRFKIKLSSAEAKISAHDDLLESLSRKISASDEVWDDKLSACKRDVAATVTKHEHHANQLESRITAAENRVASREEQVDGLGSRVSHLDTVVSSWAALAEAGPRESKKHKEDLAALEDLVHAERAQRGRDTEAFHYEMNQLLKNFQKDVAGDLSDMRLTIQKIKKQDDDLADQLDTMKTTIATGVTDPEEVVAIREHVESNLQRIQALEKDSQHHVRQIDKAVSGFDGLRRDMSHTHGAFEAKFQDRLDHLEHMVEVPAPTDPQDTPIPDTEPNGMTEAQLDAYFQARLKAVEEKIETLGEEDEGSDDNIRVFIRVRPPNDREQAIPDEHPLEFINTKGIHVPDRSSTVFAFDQVFRPDTTQNDIFGKVAKRTVCDVLAGYNGTIFAYGQTGSGKTYTMFATPQSPGIIPRAIEMLFHALARPDPNRKHAEVEASFLEIYQEKVSDLFAKKKKTLRVREKRGDGGVYAEGAGKLPVPDADTLLKALQKAEKNRKTAATSMNDTSSRSHTLLQITVTQKFDGTTHVGTLNLADLAGSEKVKKSQAEGETLKEAQQINLSLSVLGLCINKLSQVDRSDSRKAAHIPFRDSKLTFLLRDSLGGNTKTSLLAACSPHTWNRDETMSTIRFAQNAKEVTNKVKINRVRSPDELAVLVRSLRLKLKKAYETIAQLESHDLNT